MEVLYSFPARSSAPRRLFFELLDAKGWRCTAEHIRPEGLACPPELLVVVVVKLRGAANCSRLRSTAARFLTNLSPLSTLLYCLANSKLRVLASHTLNASVGGLKRARSTAGTALMLEPNNATNCRSAAPATTTATRGGGGGGGRGRGGRAALLLHRHPQATS